LSLILSGFVIGHLLDRCCKAAKKASMSTFAYTTIVTDDTQLVDVVTLASSLRRDGAQFPLVVLCGPNISSSSIRALKNAAPSLHMMVDEVGMTRGIPEQSSSVASSGTSSADTGSQNQKRSVMEQLQIFAPCLWNYEMVCYIALGSVIVRGGMDLVFTEASLPTDDFIAATQLCTCGLPTSSIAISSSAKAPGRSCPHSNMDGGSIRRITSFNSLAGPIDDPDSGVGFEARLLVFYPSERLWDKIMTEIAEGVHGQSFGEIVNRAFKDRWMVLPWWYYGTPGLLRWHNAIWQQDRPVCVEVSGFDTARWASEAIFEQFDKQRWQILDSWKQDAVRNENLRELASIVDNETRSQNSMATENEHHSSAPQYNQAQTLNPSEFKADYSDIYKKKGSSERGHGPAVRHA
jgi:hypothetical protein